MVKHVSKSVFKAHALEIFRQVETSGEPVVVTDHGEPRLEVRRFHSHERQPLDILRGSVLRFERPTDPVAEDDWEAAQ